MFSHHTQIPAQLLAHHRITKPSSPTASAASLSNLNASSSTASTASGNTTTNATIITKHIPKKKPTATELLAPLKEIHRAAEQAIDLRRQAANSTSNSTPVAASTLSSPAASLSDSTQIQGHDHKAPNSANSALRNKKSADKSNKSNGGNTMSEADKIAADQYVFGGSELLRSKYIRTLEVLSDSQREIQSEVKSNQDLRKQVQLLEAQLASSNVKNMREEIDLLKAQNAELKLKADQMQKAHQDKIAHLNLQKQELASQHSQAVSKQTEKLSVKVIEAEAARDKLQKQYNDLVTRYQTQSELLEEANHKIKAMSADRDEVDSRIQAMEQQRLTVEQARDDLVVQVRTLETKITELTETIKSSANRQKDSVSSSDAQKLEKQLQEYIRLYADSQGENDKLRTEVRKADSVLEAQRAAAEATLSKETKKLKAQIKQQEDQINELLSENNRLKEFFMAQQSAQNGASSSARSKNSEFGPFTELKRENMELRNKLNALTQQHHGGASSSFFGDSSGSTSVMGSARRP